MDLSDAIKKLKKPKEPIKDSSAVDVSNLNAATQGEKDYNRRLREVYLEEWYPWLEKYTFPSKFLDLSVGVSWLN